jgi:5,5'-dehydrodivanillate O-demethylase
MAHVDHRAFVQTGPGTLAGRYLRSFWQPVAHADDVGAGQAIPRRILNEEFTLYRGEGGQPHLVAFRCAHRGTQLSTGWVEGDCIRCIYHGWKYEHTGQCVEMPAEDPSFPPKVRIRSYPVREYLGLIFAYLGEGGPPRLPRYPQFEDGLLEFPSVTRRCNYFSNLENSLDVAHVGFVHRSGPSSFDGITDSPNVFEAEETEWGIDYYVEHPSGKQFRSQFGMPNVFHHTNFPRVPELVSHSEFLTFWVPIDDESHYQFSVSVVRLKGDVADRYVELRDQMLAKRDLSHQDLAEFVLAGELRLADIDLERTDAVRLQDDVVQVGQGRVADRHHERLGRSDRGVIMIRKLWLRELRALAEGRPLKRWSYNPKSLRPLARVGR